MNLDAATTFAEGSHVHIATRSARKLADERGTSSRKHFLDAYAEHLEAMRRNRTSK